MPHSARIGRKLQQKRASGFAQRGVVGVRKLTLPRAEFVREIAILRAMSSSSLQKSMIDLSGTDSSNSGSSAVSALCGVWGVSHTPHMVQDRGLHCSAETAVTTLSSSNGTPSRIIETQRIIEMSSSSEYPADTADARILVGNREGHGEGQITP